MNPPHNPGHETCLPPLPPWWKHKLSTDPALFHAAQILAIYSGKTFRAASKKEDISGSDLLSVDQTIAAAVRIRNPDYMKNYGDEITIRSLNPNSPDGFTEIHKIQKNNLFLYGFSNKEQNRIIKITAIETSPNNPNSRIFLNHPFATRTNHDETGFFVYKIGQAQKMGLVRFVWENEIFNIPHNT